jgi:hypothetical protein
MSSPRSPTNKLPSSNKNSLRRAMSGQAYVNSKTTLVHGNHKRMAITFRETNTATLTIKTHVIRITRSTTQMVGLMAGVIASQTLRTTLEKEASTVITIPIPTRAAGPMKRCGSTTETKRAVMKAGMQLSTSSVHHIHFGERIATWLLRSAHFSFLYYIHIFPSRLSSYCLIAFYFARRSIR